MKVILSILFTLIFTQAVRSQEVLFNRDLRLGRGYVDRREAFPVNSVSSKQLSLFLIDNKSIKGLLLNEAMDLTDSVDGERPEGKFSELLGSSQSEGGYNLYFSNKAHDKLAVARCNYATKTMAQFEIEMPFNRQRYVGSASFEGKFYMFTIPKGSSQLNLYEFTDATHYTSHNYDFKTEHFTTNEYYFTLSDALQESPFVTVDNEIPNAIELVSKKNKLYTFDHKIMLTLDNRGSRTHVITIGLDTLEAAMKVYGQKPVDCPEKISVSTNSNSYIFKNVLYQMRLCSENMVFSLTDLSTGKDINEFRAQKDDEMNFINGPIIQKGKVTAFSPKERELSKTRQFLRKVSSSNPGISVYEGGGILEVTLGSYEEIIRASGGGMSGGMMSPGMTVPTMGGGTYTIAPTYNPTYYGYSSYKSSKSVSLNSLLDPQTFQHREGNPGQNAFDKIQEFTKDKADDIVAETIFRRDEFLLLGYYSKKDRRYEIRGYKD
jgi:hypothetical protein